MLTVEDLTAIEEIKQLKARYFRAVDTMNMDDWLQSFTEDAELTFDPSVRPSKNQEVETARFSGKAELEGRWNGLTRKLTVHHGHTPEITIISDNDASGIWAMEDIVKFSDGLLWAMATITKNTGG